MGAIGLPEKYIVQAHAALLVVALLPVVIHVPVNFNIVLSATLTVLVGCLRSVKPEGEQQMETMTSKDAMRFPFVGSAVLLSLFIAYKFLPKEWLNGLLTIYFIVLGLLAMSSLILPVVEGWLPESIRNREIGISKKITIPYLLPEPTSLQLPLSELVSAILCIPLVLMYAIKKHWLANNVIAIAFSIQGIEFLSMGSVKIGTILLSGLFFYDIFWVFCTPVMVGVAKNIDAPIKLLFPRLLPEDAEPDAAKPFSMLGLGDIVIPGIYVALLLRMDVSRGTKRNYFYSVFVGYVVGLATTILVMNLFDAAQPALLYIVPAVLGCSYVPAWLNKELGVLFAYSEEGAQHEAVEDTQTEAAEGTPEEAKKDA